MIVRLPRPDRFLKIINEDGTASPVFQVFLDRFATAIETALASLEDSIVAVEAALQAAGIAIEAAENAQNAADSAQEAANNAQNVAEGAGGIASSSTSGTSELTLNAEDGGSSAAIIISNHIRILTDGTNIPITGATLLDLNYSTRYYIYYDDPSRSGGAVTYMTTESTTVAAQTGNRFLVGFVDTPNPGDPPVPGRPKPPPGFEGLEVANSN